MWLKAVINNEFLSTPFKPPLYRNATQRAWRGREEVF